MRTIIIRKVMFFILLLPVTVFTQATLDWARTANNGNPAQQDRVSDILIDNSGNVYVTGYSDTGDSTQDIETIKYASDGTLLWAMRYNFHNFKDIGSFLTSDPSGNIYVIGNVTVSPGDKDIIVIKYKPSGVMVWAKRMEPAGYTGLGVDSATCVTSDNSYIYISASIQENKSSFKQMGLIKTDFNASYVSATFGTTGINDGANSITEDISGNIYITGYTTNLSTSKKEGTSIKYNNSLVLQWVNNIPDTVDCTGYHIKTDNFGFAYVTGAVQYSPYVYYETYTAKLKSTGETIWKNTSAFGLLCGAVYHEPEGLRIDKYGNVLVAGDSKTNLTGCTHEAFILKYSTTGALAWSTVYHTLSSSGGFESIEVDSKGNFYVTGSSGSNVLTRKYSYTNDLLWSITYTGGVGKKIKVDPFGKVYVGGLHSTSGNVDYLTLKYSQTSSSPMNPIVNETNNGRYGLYDNYPNPFNPVTSIKFTIPANGSVLLSVYDNIGREVAVLVNGNLEPGEHEVTFDASSLSSGIYFYRLESGTFSEIKKMVLVK